MANDSRIPERIRIMRDMFDRISREDDPGRSADLFVGAMRKLDSSYGMVSCSLVDLEPGEYRLTRVLHQENVICDGLQDFQVPRHQAPIHREGLLGTIIERETLGHVEQLEAHTDGLLGATLSPYRSFVAFPGTRDSVTLNYAILMSTEPDYFTDEFIEYWLLFTSLMSEVTHTKILASRLRETLRANERLHQTNLYLRNEVDQEFLDNDIASEAASMRAVIDRVKQVAKSDATILLLGESGTGKEVIARFVHAASNRANEALIKLNCAALPDNLVESELFGHEQGAFTGATAQRVGRFELADGGTLFLDEVGELPLVVQAKLLRVLQEREFERVGGHQTLRSDVRIIAATNRDLAGEVEKGTFREDLYYRLNVFPIKIPPLRERREDIPSLVAHFVAHFSRKLQKPILNVPDNVMEALCRYPWPGNVRELENLIERSIILATSLALELDVDFFSQRPIGRSIDPNDLNLRRREEDSIRRALQRAGGRIEGNSGAASLLGIPPSTLRDRMRRYRIK